MSNYAIVHRRRGDPIDPSAIADRLEDSDVETILCTDLEDGFAQIESNDRSETTTDASVVVVTSAHSEIELHRRFETRRQIGVVDARLANGLSRSVGTNVVVAAAQARLAFSPPSEPEPDTTAERVLVVGSASIASDIAPVATVTLVVGERPTREIPGVETHAGRVADLEFDGSHVVASLRTDRGERTIDVDQVVWPGYDGDLVQRPDVHDHADAGIVADVISLARDRARDPVEIDPSVCAVGTRGVPGCSACGERCPYDAIDIGIDGEGSVDVDPIDCVDCGACLAVCPTEAIGSPRDETLSQLEAMTTASVRAATAEAGSRIPLLSGSDGPVLVAFVTATVEPALRRVLVADDRDCPPLVPIPVSRAQRVPSALVLAAIASGIDGVVLLEDPDRSSTTRTTIEDEPVERIAAAANETTTAIGFGDRARGICTDDPDVIERAVEELEEAIVDARNPEPSDVRTISRAEFGRSMDEPGALASYELERAAIVSLAEGTAGRIPAESLGRIDVESDGCTLCEACDGLCPTGALEQPDATTLSLDAAECIGCGRCLGCPEDVITLEHRVDPSELLGGRQTIVESAAVECERCGRPFASEASLEAIEGLFGPDSGVDADTLDLQYCPQCRRRHSIGG